MSNRFQKHGFDIYTIQASDGETEAMFVPDRGGVMASLKMRGNDGLSERLYQHDFFWDKTIADLPGAWPFCFPVCGRLERQGKLGEYLYDGQLYQLPIHGFAWQLPWQVLHHESNAITLCLTDTEKTRLCYPFHFRVSLNYVCLPSKILCYQTYENCGQIPMPYSAGFHPYFLTPLPSQGKAQVELSYQPLRRYVYNDALTDLIGETHLFSLPTSVTNPEINEQLTQVAKDNNMRLSYPNGDVLHMSAYGKEMRHLFPFMQLYTMPDKPFICIEPWMAHPNAMNTVSGMRWLAPNTKEHGVLELCLGV